MGSGGRRGSSSGRSSGIKFAAARIKNLDGVKTNALSSTLYKLNLKAVREYADKNAITNMSGTKGKDKFIELKEMDKSRGTSIEALQKHLEQDKIKLDIARATGAITYNQYNKEKAVANIMQKSINNHFSKTKKANKIKTESKGKKNNKK